jgi:toxin-antitoxin system PIN domain toxin
MILVDANLLVYAGISSSVHHERARAWLDGQLNGTTAVGLPWVSLLAFLRLVTNPRIYRRPHSMEGAWGQVLAWLSCESVWIPNPGERHAALLGDILRSGAVYADRVPDAHLATLALEHGLVLCSADTGFARFPGLRWSNPLSQ